MLLSVAECLKKSAELDSVSDSARLDTELLLAHTLKKDRAWLYTWPEKTLSNDELTTFSTLFAKRLCGEPIAYLLGKRDFWSLNLKVSEATLIPRPETELLVELALEKVSNTRSVSILDLGTGTGAIALALGKELPSARVLGLDSSQSAVDLAKENAVRNGVENVEFIRSHWFDAIAAAGSGKFDLIVSNPPYVDPADPLLQQGDVRFEPASALSAEEKGYADLKHIIKYAKDYLLPSAHLLVEHGWQQGHELRHFFNLHAYKEIETRKDFAGNERVTLAIVE